MIEPPDYIPDLRRLHALIALTALLLGVITARLWFLQIVKGPELLAQSTTLRTRKVRRVAARGAILDAQSRVLATSRSQFVVSVLPDELKKNPQMLPRLAQLLHKTEDELTALIDENRKTPVDPVPVVLDAEPNLLAQIEEQRLDLPGVLITKDPVRYYVDNQVCTHVLGVTRPISAAKLEKLRDQGYRGGDFIGVEGLEAAYESELRGQDGGQIIEVDARGRMQRSLGEDKPIAGHTLRLTIDRDLQQVAYNALKEVFQQRQHPGAAVALDPNTGAVLALVSMPSYDLNSMGRDYAKLSGDKQYTPLVNRATYSRYPCGSTFKLVTAAAGMEAAGATRGTAYYCPGFIRRGNRIFHCDKRSGHGRLGMAGAIGASCDVYFWRLAEQIGPGPLADWAHRFGLGQPTGIDLPPSVDKAGYIPTPQWKRKTRRGAWVPGDLLNMSIGQGMIGVTPLQLANYTAALANGGNLMRPQLVREILDASTGTPHVLHTLQPEVRARLGLRPETRDTIVEGMERALQPGGTAYGSTLPGLTIAGKTGTAEAVVHGKSVSHSVFVCFAPADKPRIAIAVLVEGGGFGADVAAPIARRMLNRYFHLKQPDTPLSHHLGGD